MSLVRNSANYEGFIPSAFDGFFNGFFNDRQLADQAKEAKFLPSADVIEQEEFFELQVALPGINKEDVELDIADNVLTLRGERKLKNEKKEGRYYSFETRYGTFTRSFRLPDNVDQTKINASYSDGMLCVNLPKIDEHDGVKTSIKIK